MKAGEKNMKILTQGRVWWLVVALCSLTLPALVRQARSLPTSTGPYDPLGVHGYTLDGNGLAEPGETVSMTVSLVNRSEESLDGVQAAIHSASAYVTLTHTTPISYGELQAGQIKVAPQPFGFQVGDDAPEGQVLTFTLTLSATGAGPWLDELAVPVGGWQVHLPMVCYNHTPARIPNDAYYGILWAPPKINAPQAWQITTGTPSVVIAIADTGVDLDHPDLASQLWVNGGEVPDNGLDDDGNGFVDDIHGYDFWDDDPDPDDEHYESHGTHVAGIAAAATNNEIGVAALGWDSALMPLKTQNADGIGTTNELAEAVVYAADNGASVVNISVGLELTLCPSALQAAINHADAQGVLVVAAVGNQDEDPNKDFYPAACEDVLGVAATTSWDARIGTDYGAYVDVSAPGHDIYSTLRGGTYGYKSGTSMASPLVSGLAALLYARFPHYDDEEVAWAILSHVVDLGDPGKDGHYGWGRVNAYPPLLWGASGTPDYGLGSAEGEGTAVGGAFAPGELLVGLRPECTGETKNGPVCPLCQSLASPGVRWLDAISQLGVWRVAVPAGQELAYLEAWRADPCLAFVELNYLTDTP
jgi:subtilisin family serine protease